MGWLWLALIGAAASVLLAVAGLERRLWSLVGAALMLGAGGYALQGRPSLNAAPTAPDRREFEAEPGLLAFRDSVLRPAPEDARVLHAADGRIRDGDARGAAALILVEIERRPRDATLWAGLGGAIAAHDGQPSPAALFAFRRAAALDPRDPGPPFLLGLVHLEAGDLPATERAWALALALAPADAPYRVGLAEQLMLVRQFGAMAERAR